jgi:hypothetical protein
MGCWGSYYMFERFDDRARRVIFFARYEASVYGSPVIDTEHLLLGVLRQNGSVAFGCDEKFDLGTAVRRDIETRITRKEPIPTSAEVPLSMESRQALMFAVEEAENMGDKQIVTEHLILGLLRIENGMAASVLATHKVTLSQFRSFWGQSRNAATAEDLAQMGRNSVIAEVFLRNFLIALRNGSTEASRNFFSLDAEFVDAYGQRHAGETGFDAKFGELFAPFSARKAEYFVVEMRHPHQGVCIACVLWAGVPSPEKPATGLLQMVLTLGQDEEGASPWNILSVQITPVTRL